MVPCIHRLSPHPPAQLEVRCGLNRPWQAATPTGGHWEIAARRTDGHGDPMDPSQPQGPTASSVRGDLVDVTGAKLSRPPLLCRIGRYGDQHPNPRGPCSWG
jgi:hypothetical protein